MSARPRTLADFPGDVRPSGEQLNFRQCPVCGSADWKVYVNPQTGGWNCFAGRCGAKGFVEVGLDSDEPSQHLLDLLRPAPEHEWEELELPPWTPLERMAAKYLEKRGVDAALARRLGLVEWEDKFRILIPYFDRAGNLIYWNSRRYSDMIGEGPKYLTAPGRHPLYHLPAESDTLVVVEGVFDAIAVHRAGYGAVALGGKSLPAYLKKDLLTIARPYAILVGMLDSDAFDAALRLRAQLSDVRPIRLRLPVGKDPGGMTPDEIKELLG